MSFTTEKNGLIQHHRAMRCTQTILLIHLTPCTHHRSQQYQHGNGKVGATVVALRPSEIAAQYTLRGQTSGKKDGKATWPWKDTSQFGWYIPLPFQISIHFSFRGCLVSTGKFYSLSHRMFGHMHEVLNIDEKNN